ncbi:hypothetical protein C8J57DRAFT_1227804 [Mycena rebaudengoi]|nr:hypothetical protein C8J57DRAFT_1227804 [Mycena rebaudengoi]
MINARPNPDQKSGIIEIDTAGSWDTHQTPGPHFLPSYAPINILPPDPASEPTAFQLMLEASTSPIRSRRSRVVPLVPTAEELQLARDAQRDFSPQLREMESEAQTLDEEGEYEAQMAMLAADYEA